TGAEPHHIRILRVYGDAPERIGAAVVENGLKIETTIGRLPEPAGSRSKVPHTAVVGVDRNVLNPARAERAGDVADLNIFDQVGSQPRRGPLLSKDQAERASGESEHKRMLAEHRYDVQYMKFRTSSSTPLP